MVPGGIGEQATTPQTGLEGLSDGSTAAGDRLYAKMTWRLLPFFCLCLLAAYIDRVNVGFAKLQMLGDLHFSETIYGWGAGLFFVGYILCEIPSNVILQRVGARIWIARIMLTWGLLSGATMLVHSPQSYYIVRFLLGVAEAGFMPGALFFFSSWYPLHRRSRITALFMLGIPLSSVIGAPLSGWIMAECQGQAGLAGWQWLFLLEAIPSICLGVAALFVLPASIEKTSWLTNDEKRQLSRDLKADRHEDEIHLLVEAFRNGKVWLIGLIDGTLLLGLYSIAFWLPTIIHRTGVASPLTIGLLTAIPHGTGVVTMLILGWNSDRTHERRWHVALPMAVGAAGLALSTVFTDDLTMTVVLMAVANAGIIGALPALWAIPGSFLVGRAAAAGLALALSMANLAGFFSTYLVGWVIDQTHSASLALLFFALCVVLGGLTVLFLPAKLVNR